MAHQPLHHPHFLQPAAARNKQYSNSKFHCYHTLEGDLSEHPANLAVFLFSRALKKKKQFELAVRK